MPLNDDASASTSTPASTEALPFRFVADLIREHALERPDHTALIDDRAALGYRELDRLMDRVAASLQRDGVRPTDAVAICAATSVRYAAIYLGALRAGIAVAPLSPSVTPKSFASMLADAGATRLFVDRAAADALGTGAHDGVTPIALEDGVAGISFDTWLMPEGSRPAQVDVRPEWAFNIIYSSGTTGQPKGIVQSHAMRWTHVMRGRTYDYGEDGVTLLATPLYSNTTLVVFFPTLAFGGTVVLMPKFDAAAYLALAERRRATHTMLVPVQYQRIMALPDFDDYDLRSYRFKFCTSAPFSAALKANVLARWPGGLVEFYGMTEGGGTCILAAHLHPTKLHTVGLPAEGHEVRLIDDDGAEATAGSIGEVVGRSAGMMTGYHRQPQKTRDAEWFDTAGRRFIRTGDIGRFDEDGFLVLMDRRKDMIISGGFNVYPSDLEALLHEHPAVREAAVVGVPSTAWGETPIAFVVTRDEPMVTADELTAWINRRVGKTQRIARLSLVDELPRSAIGKVLKRELRDAHVASGEAPR